MDNTITVDGRDYTLESVFDFVKEGWTALTEIYNKKGFEAMTFNYVRVNRGRETKHLIVQFNKLLTGEFRKA